jgi:hypothetical protein
VGNPENPVALRTILAAAELLRAKACVVLSAESSNVEADWLSKLLQPIRQDSFDLVVPTYRRHKFEGLLITNLLYPMIRALYGSRIREPYTHDFGFSGKIGSDFLLNVDNNGGGSSANELRFVLAAMAEKRRVCQSFLGEKQHVEQSSSDLVPALRQTVGPLFSAMEADFPMWSAVSGSQPVVTSGPDQEVLLDAARINRKRLREMFASGVTELAGVFQAILLPSTLAELQQVAGQSESQFCYSTELWAKTVYEFAASYKKSVINRDHILQALAPLFRGRALTFVTENRSSSAEEIEHNIETLCLEFERQKPYLLQLWKSGE